MSIAQFLEFLERSGLMTPERLATAQAMVASNGGLEGDATPFAEALIKGRLLTHFQAERLLRGKWRNFIINDKFRVLDRWDSGDLGIFFRCEHLTLRRNVVLRSHVAFTDDTDHDLKGLLDRIRALSPVSDPHLAKMIDLERVNDQPLLVMEDLTGPSVEELIGRNGPLSLEQAASYTSQAALGLQTLHEAGWVHGDVRPARMIFDPNRLVKMIDPALSHWLGNPRQGSRSKSRTGEKGFPSWDYSAPESFEKGGQVDGRADLYSLGCSLYHMLAGQPPFAAYPPAEKVKAHHNIAAPNLAGIRQDLPPQLHQVLRGMLAKDPDQRPGAGAEVAQALLPWARQQLPSVTQAMLGVASYREDMPPEVEKRRNQTAPGVPRSRKALKAKRNRILTLVAAAIALVAVAIFVFFLVASLGGMRHEERLEQVRKAMADENTVKAAELLADGLKQADAKNQNPQRKNERVQLLNLLASFKQREDLLTAVATQLPNDAEVQLRLADVQTQGKNWIQAALSYSRATAADPARVEGWDKFAQMLMAQGNWKAAASTHAKALDLNPEDSSLWLRQAVLHARAGETTEFKDLLSKMWKKFKDSGNSTSIAHVAQAAMAAPRPPVETAEIQAALKAALDRLPGQGWPRYAYGAMLYRQGQYEQALQELRRAYDENPSWASRQICLPLISAAELRLNKRAEAQKTYNEADAFQRTQRERLPSNSFVPINKQWWDWVLFDMTLGEARAALQAKT